MTVARCLDCGHHYEDQPQCPECGSPAFETDGSDSDPMTDGGQPDFGPRVQTAVLPSALADVERLPRAQRMADGGSTQTTLNGEELEVDRPHCELYDFCEASPKWEVTSLVYKPTGAEKERLRVCETCAFELTEPDYPEDAENARELRAPERLIADGGRPIACQIPTDVRHGGTVHPAKGPDGEWIDVCEACLSRGWAGPLVIVRDATLASVRGVEEVTAADD